MKADEISTTLKYVVDIHSFGVLELMRKNRSFFNLVQSHSSEILWMSRVVNPIGDLIVIEFCYVSHEEACKGNICLTNSVLDQHPFTVYMRTPASRTLYISIKQKI